MHSFRSALRFFVGMALLAAPGPALGDADEEAEPGSPGVVRPLWVDESTFNAFPKRAGFQLSNESYDTDPETVRIFVNGKFSESFTIEPQLITVDLPAGEHLQVDLFASDTQGRMIEAEFAFWGGGSRTRVRVLDSRGAPVEGATVTASLQRDERIRAQATTDATGRTPYFEGLPDCCVAFAARGAHGEFDSASATPKRDTELTLQLRGFHPPSEVDNNDFHRGLEGWETGDVSVELVPHREDPSAAEATPGRE